MAKILAKGTFKGIDYCVRQGSLGTLNGYFIAPNGSNAAERLVTAYRDLDGWAHESGAYKMWLTNANGLFHTLVGAKKNSNCKEKSDHE